MNVRYGGDVRKKSDNQIAKFECGSLNARLAVFDDSISPADFGSAVLRRMTVESGLSVWQDAEGRQSLYLLMQGFAYRFVFLPGGKRHIEDIYGPGSICNWTRLHAPDYRCNLTFKAGTKVALLDPRRFAEVIRSKARVDEAMRRLELARTLRVSQRVRALISLPAAHRISILLLDLREEHRLAGASGDWIPFCLTQEELADAVGLTEVHVNRTLSKMEQAGELARRHGEFCLPNSAQLERQLHYRRFHNGYSREEPWD